MHNSQHPLPAQAEGEAISWFVSQASEGFDSAKAAILEILKKPLSSVALSGLASVCKALWPGHLVEPEVLEGFLAQESLTDETVVLLAGTQYLHGAAWLKKGLPVTESPFSKNPFGAALLVLMEAYTSFFTSPLLVPLAHRLASVRGATEVFQTLSKDPSAYPLIEASSMSLGEVRRFVDIAISLCDSAMSLSHLT